MIAGVQLEPFMKTARMVTCILIAGLFLSLLSACVHNLTLQSGDGEEFHGRYRFARGNTALVEITDSEGELWRGKFAGVSRAVFIDSYEQAFGRGSIAADRADVSAYGNAFAGMVGSSYALTDAAYGETAGATPIVVKGPLFYWTAVLNGHPGHTMNCYLIGSASAGGGFGRCKNHIGKEYSVRF
jgi:hypothetical protein